MGLMTAIDTCDYQRGYKFSTYATWWFREAVGGKDESFKNTN